MRTSSLTPQDMQEFGARHDKEVEADWNKILQLYLEGKSTTADTIQVEGRQCMNLTFQILKDDLIEKCGFIDHSLFQGTRDSALQALCRNITYWLNADLHIVTNMVTDFAAQGYLSSVISDKGCSWSWS